GPEGRRGAGPRSGGTEVTRRAAGGCRPIPFLPVARAGEADDEPLVPEVRAQVVQGQHCLYAIQRERSGFVDAADDRVGMRAAHKSRMERTRQANIVDEAALSAEKRKVLEPADVPALDAPARAHALLLLDCAQAFCRIERGGDDALVAGTSAEIAGEGYP